MKHLRTSVIDAYHNVRAFGPLQALKRAGNKGKKGAFSLSIEFVITAVVAAALLPTFFNSWTGLVNSANISGTVKVLLELTPLLVAVGILYYYGKKAGVKMGQ